jgi:drug/metabolite transporter (DMT)-like permease
VAGRRGLRAALTPAIVLSGAGGFGAVVALQNAGIAHTSVSQAAVVVGAVPVLVALIAAALGHGRAGSRAWGGYVLALAGVALVAGSGGGASATGDALVLASATLSAAFIVVQPRLLTGRDAAAVTAVQFVAGALAVAPLAALTHNPVPSPAHPGAVLAVAALGVAGTILPFWLFAFGQARVTAHLAGAFVNLEPLVGAICGWVAFGDSAGLRQLVGAGAVLAGIALSSLAPEPAPGRRPRAGRVEQGSGPRLHRPTFAVHLLP